MVTAHRLEKESKYVVKEQWDMHGTKGRGIFSRRRCKTVICWSIKSQIIMSLWHLTKEFRQCEKGNKKAIQECQDNAWNSNVVSVRIQGEKQPTVRYF